MYLVPCSTTGTQRVLSGMNQRCHSSPMKGVQVGVDWNVLDEKRLNLRDKILKDVFSL